MKGLFRGIQTLISNIKSIIYAIKIGITFILNLIESLFKLIQLLITTIANTTTLIATLPSWLIAFATCTLAIAVLYVILGRESGKNK